MRNPGDMEKGEYIRKLVGIIIQSAQRMHEAAISDDEEQFTGASLAWNTASYEWLMAAQNMSTEKAHATMIDFARRELTQWRNKNRPGPPPSILSRYQ